MDAQCVHVQRRPPARSAARLVATDERQRHGLRWPDCTAREVQGTSRRTNLTQYPFETYLPKSGLTSQVCRCLWRRGLDMLDCAGRPAFLSTQANGHPLPVACRREDGLCWWYVSAWPSGRRNEGMQPYSPPPPDGGASYAAG